MSFIKDAYSASIGFAKNEKTTPLKGINNIFHNTVNATIGNVSKYVSDIVNPGYQMVKNVGNIINYKAYKREGFKNLFKAGAGVVTQGSTAVKNATLGLVSVGRTFYREGIQNNLQLAQNFSSKHIPVIGDAIKHTTNAVSAIIGAPLAAAEKTVTYVDSGFGYINESVRLEGQKIKSINARRQYVSEPSNSANDDNYQLAA